MAALRQRPSLLKFILVGLVVAGLEECVTQGLLKGQPVGWIIPTIIAFVPFLLLVQGVAAVLERYLEPPPAAAAYYLIAGTVGLQFEWWVMGLSPWNDPNLLQIPFQLGMFSFWGSVAFAPRVVLGRAPHLARSRQQYLRCLTLGFLLIYTTALVTPKEHRFLPVIAAVLFTFLALNVPVIGYLRALRDPREGAHPKPGGKDED